jgi:ribosome-associated protein
MPKTAILSGLSNFRLTMIQITMTLAIDEAEVQEDFVRASGPGGQNVNKVSTAVQIRFDALHSPSLPEEVRARLIRLAGSKLTDDGILIITAQSYRTLVQNRQDALDQLVALLKQASQRPKLHLKTRPTLASKQRRLEVKRQRSQTKSLRRTRIDRSD